MIEWLSGFVIGAVVMWLVCLRLLPGGWLRRKRDIPPDAVEPQPEIPSTSPPTDVRGMREWRRDRVQRRKDAQAAGKIQPPA